MPDYNYGIFKLKQPYAHSNSLPIKLMIYLDSWLLISYYRHRKHCTHSTKIVISLTRSSKMSLWCTWIVMSVSNFVLTTLVNSLVVCSISTFNSSRKAVLVCCMTFLSYLAFVSASVESLVQIIWIPNRPTYTKTREIYLASTPGLSKHSSWRHDWRIKNKMDERK